MLDSTFLKNLIPLKSPPTMITGTMTDLLSVSGSVNNSLVSPTKHLADTSLQSNVNVLLLYLYLLLFNKFCFDKMKKKNYRQN